MNEAHPIEQAIAAASLSKLAIAVGKTHQAIRKWQRAGRFPRTEWTGETSYAKQIEEVCGGAVSAEQLLKPWPKWPAEPELQLVDRREKSQPIDFPDRRAAAQGTN